MYSSGTIYTFNIYLSLFLFGIGFPAHSAIPSASSLKNPLKDVLVKSAKLNTAEEPTSQPGNLTFSNVKTYTYDAFFNNANPQPEFYIVLRSIGQAVVGAPVDGVTYHVGDAIGNARVVFVGGDAEFSPSGVLAGTTFFHSIFSFNGTGGNENYLTSDPLTGSLSTPLSMMEDYYQEVNSKNENFVEVLQNTIRPHYAFDYGDYPQIMINGFEARDTTGGQKVVYCVYTGYAHIYDEPFGWIGSPGGTLSREHTFPFSWYPHSSESAPEYSDFHHLFPVHQNNANNRRSNHPLGVVQNVDYQFLDGKRGTDAQGNIVYEPRDAHKGDAARALFYMVTRYHNSGGYEWYLPPQQDQEVLKLWHFTDPPDAWEMARNDYIYSRQGNRNPFIDSMHFVTKIDFSSMEWLSIEQINQPGFKASIYPNPARDFINLEIHALSPGRINVLLLSLTGVPVISMESELNTGPAPFRMELLNLPKGAYILKIIFNDQTHSVKVMKM
jgi:hypothetical protein